MMNSNKEHIRWVDGLRGIACLGIYLIHFTACFYEKYVNNPQLYPNSLFTRIGQTPLSVFFNGSNFFVLVFCMISGMFASSSILDRQSLDEAAKEKISDSLIKRYMRLFFPVFAVNIIVFLMLHLGWMSNTAFSERVVSNWAGMLYYEFDPHSTFLTLLLDSFVRVPFQGSTKYCLAYWSLPHLFYGFFLSVVLTQMSWGKTKHILWLYLGLSLCLLIAQLDMTACFSLGTAFAFWRGKRHEYTKTGTVFGGIVLIAGMFLGGFPIYSEPTGLYAALNHAVLKIPAYMLWHYLGAGMAIAGLFMCKPLQDFLSLKIFRQLGEISFSLYLLHIAAITSVGTGVAIYLMDNSALEYSRISLISLCLVSAVLIPFAVLFRRYIERPCGRLSELLVNKLKTTEK